MRTFTDEELLEAMRAAECACPACAGHEDVHEHVDLELLGTTVRVERASLELVAAINAAGIVTCASCVDLRAVILATRPSAMSELMAQSGRPGMHYGGVLVRGVAYVRLALSNPRAVEFALAAQAVPGVTVRSGMVAGYPVAQVEYPKGKAPALLEVLPCE